MKVQEINVDNITFATSADSSQIAELLITSWENREFESESLSSLSKIINYNIEENREYFLISKSEDRIMGVLSFEICKAKIHIKRFYVKKEEQNRGIGERLLNKCIRESDGIKLYLEVNVDNQKAMQYYKKRGFVIVGEKEMVFREQKIEIAIMEK